MALGIKPTSDREEVKKAYRELAKTHHPDRNPDSPLTAAARYKAITEAYNLLDDAQKRKEYDELWRKLRIPKDISAGPKPKQAEPPQGFFARLFSPKKAESKNNYSAFFTAGITCFQYPGGKLTEQAEVEFRNAVKANPESMDARYNLALACYWQGKFAESLSLLREAAKKYPADALLPVLIESLTETPA